MTSIYLNQQSGSDGGPQVWSSRFRAILEARGFRVTSDLGADWAAALFVNDTYGMDQAIKTGRPVAYRVANGYLPAWFQQMRREMEPQHHLVNAKIAYGLEYASTVIYQSQWAKNSLDENLSKCKNVFAVIHNGVDLQHFTPAVAQPSSGRKRPAIIGTVGRLRYRYRLETFLEMSRFIEEPHKLLIVGSLDAECRRVLTSYQADRLIGPRIIYQAHVLPDALPGLYQSMDLLVHPVCGDVCPNVVVEGLACGVPVVVPHYGGSAELVGEAGVVFDCQPWVYDAAFIDTMASAANRALEKKALLSLRARQRAEEHFDLRVMTDRYLETMMLPQSGIADLSTKADTKKQIRERIISQRSHWRRIHTRVTQKIQQHFSQIHPLQNRGKLRVAFIHNAFERGCTLEVFKQLVDHFGIQYDFYFLEIGEHNYRGDIERYAFITGPLVLAGFLQKQRIDVLHVNSQRWVIDAALSVKRVHIIAGPDCTSAKFPGSMDSITHWVDALEDVHEMTYACTKIYQDLTNAGLLEA